MKMSGRGTGRHTVRNAVVAAAVVALVAAGARVVLRRRDARTGMVTGRAQRTARLARVSARASADFASMKARSAVASPERRGQLQAQFELRSAEQVAEVLGDMKGALMKIGQMASYLDDGMPEPVRVALASLQQDAPPMAPELCAEVIRAELGDDPERVTAR